MPVKNSFKIKSVADIRGRCYVDEAGCWVWRLSVTKGTKAPQTSFQGKTTTTRRLALRLIGRSIERGMFAVCRPGCHDLCVNPYHIMSLTGPDYWRHLAAVGVLETPAHKAARVACTRGRDTTKLTRGCAESIRHRVASGEDRGALAAELGISRGHLNRVVRGANWAPAQEVRGSSVFAWCQSIGGER